MIIQKLNRLIIQLLRQGLSQYNVFTSIPADASHPLIVVPGITYASGAGVGSEHCTYNAQIQVFSHESSNAECNSIMERANGTLSIENYRIGDRWLINADSMQNHLFKLDHSHGWQGDIKLKFHVLSLQ